MIYFISSKKYRLIPEQTCIDTEALNPLVYDAAVPSSHRFICTGSKIISPKVVMPDPGDNYAMIDGAYFVTDEKCYFTRLKHLRNIVPNIMARIPGCDLFDIDSAYGICLHRDRMHYIMPLHWRHVRILKVFPRKGIFFIATEAEFSEVIVDHKYDSSVISPCMTVPTK